jgi:nitrite reductase (NADH) small subunit
MRFVSQVGEQVSWHDLCALSELEQNVGREFVVNATVLAVFFDGQELYAIDGMCAHQGGPIAQGKLDGKCVTCPWHGWQYDIADGKNLLTGKQMLDCYAVEVREGRVWVELE